jgi:two-component system phosphate regulon sensor histidine kinase PhoR
MTKPLLFLSIGVLVPVVLSTTVGIIAIVSGNTSRELVLGVLSVALAASAVGSAIVVIVLLGLRARTARLQTDLLGNVSHELRTPLAAIRMYAQTLQAGTVQDNPQLIRQCADTIARETEWLSVMIERLLTWRAAARDRDNLTMVSQPLSELVCEIADRFRCMLPPDEMDFSATIETSMPVRHDRNGMGSVLLNLLTNAYKYSAGPRRIQLSAVDEGDHVILRVSDNGMGIATDQVQRIFEPFYRGGAGTSSPESGAGLGLAIVDYMVRAHGGTVSVETSLGSGSTFTVRLPADPGRGSLP